MAAGAVGLHKLPVALGKRDLNRRPAGMEDGNVLPTGDAFPNKLYRRILMRQMTVDAANVAMRPNVEPYLVLGLHDMAGAARQGHFRPGQELGRSESQKAAHSTAQDEQRERDLQSITRIMSKRAMELAPCQVIFRPSTIGGDDEPPALRSKYATIHAISSNDLKNNLTSDRRSLGTQTAQCPQAQTPAGCSDLSGSWKNGRFHDILQRIFCSCSQQTAISKAVGSA